jgi:hypothetical protein
MKSVITRGLGLAIVALGFLAAAPMASAQITNHSGTICKNYNAEEATLIDYLTNGTRSYKTSATSIICPLTRDARNPSNTNGGRINIYVTHTGTQTTTCTAFSNRDPGEFLASSTQTSTGSGTRLLQLNLTGPGKSSPGSDYSVLCSIPGNSSGVVHSVDLLE